MIDYTELLKQREQVFTETRYEIIKRVTATLEGLTKIDPQLLATLPPLPGNTVQEVFPALFTEPFNKEAYQQQLAVYNTFKDQANLLIDKLNKEAIECLS